MHCVKSERTIEDTIKKSRFIGIVCPCETEAQALQKLRQLAGQYDGASHIAFAYRILTERGIVMRMHDAGEPGGTAGKPIYQHLEGKDLINTMVVVVRYFGGIKLGAGGLARAYGNSAKNAIAAAGLVDFVVYEILHLTLDYKQLPAFEYQLQKLSGRIVEQNFSERIDLLVTLPRDNVDVLRRLM